MAKRKDRPPQAADPATASAGPNGEAAGDQQFVIFRCAGGLFAFRVDEIAEVLRVPRLVHMPLAPPSLEGLANLRGVVLPVVSLAGLLGFPMMPHDDAARVIVIGEKAPVGFIVDRIEGFTSFPAERIELGDAAAGAIEADFLDGVVKGAEGQDSIKILRPQALLTREFAYLSVSKAQGATAEIIAAPVSKGPDVAAQRKLSLVSFELAQQEYGLPLERVREIIQLPAHISEVPRAETAVLGVVTLRDQLVPLVSLRALLGLPADHSGERAKVVVVAMGGGSVGVVADRTKEILHVDPQAIDPAPALLTRGEGDAEIVSICRLDNGKRLVALLSPDRLFRSELMSRIAAEHGATSGGAAKEGDFIAMAGEQFVIFQLGDQEYGLPIEAVREIARPPEHVTRLPKAPSFVDGVMNLRSVVVPIVDLRRRFDVAPREQANAQRILVLALGGGLTGFMVDKVSEVLMVPSEAIRPAPELSSEQMRLISRVANLDQQGRMILLVDPHQLLDQMEADLLAKFDRTHVTQASKAS